MAAEILQSIIQRINAFEWITTIAALSLLLTSSLALRIYFRFKSNPHRPFITALLDSCCEPLQFLRVGPWARPCDMRAALESVLRSKQLASPQDLQLFTGDAASGGRTAAAAANQGLGEFIERYQRNRQVGLKKSKGRFSPAAHVIVHNTLADKILLRSRFNAYLRRHPGVLRMKVRGPVFVVGFTRTGTTFLHELLGLHPAVRSHRSWEQMYPVPDTHSEQPSDLRADREKRYQSRKAVFTHLLLPLLGEAIQHVHRIGYEELEECTIPCSLELPWTISELPFTMFAAKEMADMGAGDAYRFYRQYLQLLTWQQRQSDADSGEEFTWMLKCPFHLPYIKELVSSFPDCSIVWTHRNPVECIASACSLHETLLRMVMEEDSIDAHAIGRAIMEYTALALDRAEAALAELSARIEVVHVRYADVVSSSVTLTCKTICESTGLDYSLLYEAKVREYIAQNALQRQQLQQRNKERGKSHPNLRFHDYSLERYGLSKEIVQAAFKEYIHKYKLA